MKRLGDALKKPSVSLDKLMVNSNNDQRSAKNLTMKMMIVLLCAGDG